MIAPARFPDGLELRAALELRAVEGRTLEGRAAVFNTPTRIGNFHEVIVRGAFAATLAAGKDVLALADHDPARLLARTRSGTLHLDEDGEGLAFRISLPDTQLGRDVLALAERGDLGGASIGFRAVEERWTAKDMRELRAVDLVEVSIVASHPAYAQTSVHARAQHLAQAGLNAQARRLILDRL
jgi:HK97 family phage prohead protease